MSSGFDFNELKRQLDALNETHAQEQLNVEVEERELNQMHDSFEVIQEQNRLLHHLINDNLHQAMVLSESNTAAQVLKILTQIEIEIAKFDMADGEQRDAKESLQNELQETLDVLASVRNDDQHQEVEKKIEELEKLAIEQEAEVERLNDEKDDICKDMARFRKESRQEMDELL